MQKLTDLITRALEVLVVIITAVMSILVIVNVAMRFLFDSGIVVSEELSRYLFVWVVFVGAIIAMHRNAHIYVDFIRNSFPLKVQWTVKVIIDLLMLYCCYVMTTGALEVAAFNMMDRSPVAGIPMGLVFYSTAAGGIGMGFMLLARIISLFVNYKEMTSSKPQE